MYVGITGTIGSGKGEAAQMLRRHGFVRYSFGDLLREFATKEGVPHTQTALRELATRLRRQHGPDYLAKQLLIRFQRDTPKHAVFSSIRTLAEARTLRTLNGFVLVSIDASRDARIERVIARGRRDGLATEETIATEEDVQLEGAPHEPHILDVMDTADIKVVNIGNLEELEAMLREELDI